MADALIPVPETENLLLADQTIEALLRHADHIVDLRFRGDTGPHLGDLHGQVRLLREARTIAETTTAALLEAGMRVDLGAALRRAGRTVEAREELGLAADLAHRIGATALLGRARDELAAAGTRPRRYAVRGIESLTPSELRVARLAAEGRTNREVAQALYVTPKAVEYHLANAYRKLQIAGRGELAAALREGGSTEVASV